MRADRIVIGLLGICAAWIAPAAQAASCADLVDAARGARQDAAVLESVFAQAQRECPAAEATAIGRTLGIALFNRAQKSSGETQLGDLRRAAQVARDWRILAALGQLESAQGNHEGAARSYQLALLELQENPPDPLPPPEITKRLLTMANNARAASPVYVRSITTRSGEPGADAAQSVAGVQVEAVPFPIEFVFGKTELTPSGAFAVDDLVGILGNDTTRIVLAGHTDPVGSDALNDKLSLARAEAVQQELLNRGITAVIEIAGCGERFPPVIENPDFYTQDETHQIMRRVELVRSGSPCR